jgi:putative flippase GtrA
VIHVQFVRYVIVGVASNVVLYLLYLLVTGLGMNYKLAMSLLYALGVVQTFIFNKRWSFAHGGAGETAFRRYVMTYASGYVLNLVTLTALVELGGVPHQIAQGCIFVALALLLFLAQKYWVFEKVERS